MAPSCPLSELPFVSMMALKALEQTYSLTAFSPTLESHPSSPSSLTACYKIANQYFQYALANTYCLRNVAFPANAFFDDYVLRYCSVIRKQIRELMHRFVGLLIHKLVYYQTYNQGVLLVLRSQLDPTSNNQDCLGMTPLHILACSSVHDLEVYCVIVEMYPANLITEDRWDATTALCILGGCAN